MRSIFSRRVSPALVVAVIALVAAVTGTATALPGKNSIDKNDIKKNAVSSRQIKNSSIKTIDLRDGAVTNPKLALGAVLSPNIADGQVNTADLADNAVTSPKIADGQVNTADLADNAVTSPKIADGQINTADLADNAVTSPKIADGQINTADLANGAVTAGKLGSITAQSETSAAIADGASGSANVDCPAGQRAISGGGAWSDFDATLIFLAARPIKSSADTAVLADGEVAGGWRVSGTNAPGGLASATLTVNVLCIG